jgi:hypothetical protein
MALCTSGGLHANRVGLSAHGFSHSSDPQARQPSTGHSYTWSQQRKTCIRPRLVRDLSGCLHVCVVDVLSLSLSLSLSLCVCVCVCVCGADAGIIPRLPEDPRSATEAKTEPTEEEKTSISMGISRDSEKLLREALQSHDKDRRSKQQEGEEPSAENGEIQRDQGGQQEQDGGAAEQKRAGAAEEGAPPRYRPPGGGGLALNGGSRTEGLLEQPAMMPAFRGGIGRPPPRATSDRFAFQRTRLPVYQWKNALLEEMERSQVVVIQGETGCGKTTQVPSMPCMLSPNSKH